MPGTRAIENPRSYRATSWIHRATALHVTSPPGQQAAGTDLDLQFVCYWIAFNALYGQAARSDHTAAQPTAAGERRRREQEEWLQIHSFLDEIERLDGAEAIRQAMSELRTEALQLVNLEFLYRGYWDESLRDVDLKVTNAVNLAEVAWERGTPDEHVKNVFDRIYVLRNQVFHGAAKYGSSKNRESVRPAVAVLSKLIPLFRDIVKNQGPEWRIETLPFPPKDFERHPLARRKGFANSPRRSPTKR